MTLTHHIDCVADDTAGVASNHAMTNSETCSRVLIVEDNPITQLLTLRQLSILGCAPRAASSGAEALEALRTEHFELILMDCRLPHMNGYETVRAIRAFERCYDRIPAAIVAITADGAIDVVEKCFSSGMDGHVAKPVTLGTLENVLRHFLT